MRHALYEGTKNCRLWKNILINSFSIISELYVLKKMMQDSNVKVEFTVR